MKQSAVTVTLEDCRLSGVFCIEGGKAFFAKHGLDWRQFVRNGISSEMLEQFDDLMVRKIVETARGRA
ncbi:MAG: hypothetical protein ACR2PT_24290 [Endozoicomonas sp.]